MTPMPSWLPGLLSPNGTHAEQIEQLYAVYQNDFVSSKPHYDGCPVFRNRRIRPGTQHEESFWHFITPGKHKDNNIDPIRAERLPWAGSILRNWDKAEITRWDYVEGDGDINTYLWIRDADYVMVLERRPDRQYVNVYQLVTAYPIDGEGRKKSLERKFVKRLA